ncbi:class I SAM-dependent methyltransferase [Candidatus Berkelbacteria bacterium]|nr:class I SAM-dependent methyltransferase [Candidatus Berkelbacteria bacterium]
MSLFRQRTAAYQLIDRAKALALAESWQDTALPAKQWKGVQASLDAMRTTGTRPADIETLVALLRTTKLTRGSLLEVGCSSGYMSELLDQAGFSFAYTGLDYSSAFIEFAQRQYPERSFVLGDATSLALQDRSFDLVLSGSCLLHILDYARAIQEAARVARRYVLFSKTPVLHLTDTIYTRKTAYDVPMFEIQFNESELVEHFRAAGLAVVGVRAHAQMVLRELPEPIIYKDYLCRVET